MDWVEWHDQYYRPGSWVERRLHVVRRRIREALDAAPAGEIRVLSMCAGQGLDLLGVLEDHPRAGDVRALLVELDPRNADKAREAAPPGVEVMTGDAAESGAYAGIVPVHLALVCGVFGNITDEDIHGTVASLPRFLVPGGTVIWTRHREDPDLTPAVRSWFAGAGFTEVAFDFEEEYPYGVGTHRLTGPPLPYRDDLRLFEFMTTRPT
jgi:hypothetical protein